MSSAATAALVPNDCTNLISKVFPLQSHPGPDMSNETYGSTAGGGSSTSTDDCEDVDKKADRSRHTGPPPVVDTYEKKSRVQNPWASVEDMILMEAVKNSPKPLLWNKIAEALPGRSGKQCRERWSEHLDPTYDRSPFSMEEDAIILQGQKQLGNKWKDISSFFVDKLRTPSSVKVRWHFLDRQIKKYGATADGLPNYPHISYSFSKNSHFASPPQTSVPGYASSVNDRLSHQPPQLMSFGHYAHLQSQAHSQSQMTYPHHFVSSGAPPMYVMSGFAQDQKPSSDQAMHPMSAQQQQQQQQQALYYYNPSLLYPYQPGHPANLAEMRSSVESSSGDSMSMHYPPSAANAMNVGHYAHPYYHPLNMRPQPLPVSLASSQPVVSTSNSSPELLPSLQPSRQDSSPVEAAKGEDASVSSKRKRSDEGNVTAGAENDNDDKKAKVV